MSKMKSLLAMAIVSAMASQSESQHAGQLLPAQIIDAEWKRKKCKTCLKCGSNCYPYNYKGHVLVKWSKPNYNACEKYLKRKNQ